MRALRTAAVVLLLPVALAACSGDEPGVRASPSPSSTASGSASPTPTPTQSPTPSPTTSPTPAPQAAARLTGDGIDLPSGLLEFGTPVDQALPALERAFGAPTTDTGRQSSFGQYGTCPGTVLRALEFGGGALIVQFGDVAGPGLTMYSWTLGSRGSAQALPPARALVGDAATVELRVGTSVAELQEAVGGDALVVQPADEVFPASFELRDQSGGLTGFLTGTSPQDTVTSVEAGTPCGE